MFSTISTLVLVAPNFQSNGHRQKFSTILDSPQKVMSGLTVGFSANSLELFSNLNFFFAGVLMWEVFTCGKMPYGRLKNTEVVERVQRGIILEKPKACAKEIYDVSLQALESKFNQMLITNFSRSVLTGHEKVLVAQS